MFLPLLKRHQNYLAKWKYHHFNKLVMHLKRLHFKKVDFQQIYESKHRQDILIYILVNP